MKTCLLCSNILPRYPRFLPTSLLPSRPPLLWFTVSVSRALPSAVGGLVRRGDGGRPGPEGPQPAPLHPAGAEGRPPREERAQGQSLHAAGGAGLLQKVHPHRSGETRLR